MFCASMATQMARVRSQAVQARPLLPRRRPVVPITHMRIDGASIHAVHASILVMLGSRAPGWRVEPEADRQSVEPCRRRPLLPRARLPASGDSAAAAGSCGALSFSGWLASAQTRRRLWLVQRLLPLSGKHLVPSEQ
jgi:hypothetical protein